ncbi:IclR family transcriptional regulator [Streptomyces mirabilis]|uniref:IclR family transcriptional regulator n=1 Tax=Streptomyces mirabilis TaxID=68239 RepID=UPI0038046406
MTGAADMTGRAMRPGTARLPGIDLQPSSVGKALTVLSAFSQGGGPLRVSEISRRANLPKSTTHRMLGLLVSFSLVEHGDSGYRLGGRLVELARLAGEPDAEELSSSLRPVLHRLHRSTQQTIRLAVLSGSEVVYLDTADRCTAGSPPRSAADRAPSHCTAAGKALLAFTEEGSGRLAVPLELPRFTDRTLVTGAALIAELEEIRERLVAFDHQEFRYGTVGVAAPVFSCRHKPVAAISVETGPRIPHPRELVRAVYLAACDATRQLSCPACASTAYVSRSRRAGIAPERGCAKDAA